jgi:TolB-like protein/tetratricopeptide (TPR) repeat protein
MNLFKELKRRNVFRVGFAYAVVGWLVVQVADLALENFGAPGWVMKTLLLFVLMGFVLSLFIAWAYELTPEGIKRAEDVDPNQSVTHATGRKLDRLVIVVLLMAVGLLAFERFRTDEVTEAPAASTQPAQQANATTEQSAVPVSGGTQAATMTEPPSVAVLPFVNMSSDPEQEYFSDGISEEILNVLTRIPNLKVAARTSSFQFKGKNLDIADIGRQLQVNHLLEGSVRKAGNTLRITAQLVETDSGFHLWSETFDRSPEDVFAIQDEIAAAISKELRTLLTGESNTASTPIDMQAYELYLKGRGLVARRREAALFEGIDALKSAIAIEPDYAPAMATLAKGYAVLPWFSGRVPAGQAREQAREWASKALELDPENVEALAVLAIVYSEIDLNFTGARELLEKAVNLNPGSVDANNFLGDLLTRTGDLANGLKYESRAAELDPLAPVNLTDMANVYLLSGEYDKVIQIAKRALSLDPAFTHAHQHLLDTYFILGDLEKLTQAFHTVESLPDGFAELIDGIRMTLEFARGNTAQAESILSERAALVEANRLSAATVAVEAAHIGDYDTAGELLLQAYREKDGTWIFPGWIRGPEQAPDSEPWQEFWRQPGVKELADLRRRNGLDPYPPTFGSGAKP